MRVQGLQLLPGSRASSPGGVWGCGCPVDTSAKQKHRPSRQVRLNAPIIGSRASSPGGVWGCGCPVDTSAKQKHRPSRQVRLKALILVIRNKLMTLTIKRLKS